MAAILILADDAESLVRLDLHARDAGHETLLAANVEQVRELLRGTPADLVLAELVGGPPAAALCAAVRSHAAVRNLPVIVCSSRATEADRVAAFEAGVDDYVTKPYSIRELMLRVRAVLRSPRHGAPAGDGPRSVGPIRIDPDAHRAFVEDREITLTPMEFRLLAVLLDHAGRAQSRDQLMARVWESQGDPRTVDTHVKRLREKLGPAAPLLASVRSIGYRLDSPASTPSAPPDEPRR